MIYNRFATIILLSILAMTFKAFGQYNDVTELIKETQKAIKIADGGEVIFIWWTPTEYWELSFKNDPYVTSSFVNKFMQIMESYSIFAMHHGKMSPLGSITSKSKEEITNKISITLEDSTQLYPLSENEITEDIKNYMMFIKPWFSKVLGNIGDGTEFIVFNNRKSYNKLYIDPKTRNSFSVNYDSLSFTWRLPLGSLLPNKFDPETKETFPGNYNFNPFTGNELIIKK